MNKRNTNWQPEVDTYAPTAPKTRDQLVQESRRQRQKAEPDTSTKRHPSSASATADAKAGAQVAPSGVAPEPRHEPADTYAVMGAEPTRDVRAGPGDAGAWDRPDHATQPAPRTETGRTRTVLWLTFAVAAFAGLLMILMS